MGRKRQWSHSSLRWWERAASSNVSFSLNSYLLHNPQGGWIPGVGLGGGGWREEEAGCIQLLHIQNIWKLNPCNLRTTWFLYTLISSIPHLLPHMLAQFLILVHLCNRTTTITHHILSWEIQQNVAWDLTKGPEANSDPMICLARLCVSGLWICLCALGKQWNY